jgi:hypothetical protein
VGAFEAEGMDVWRNLFEAVECGDVRVVVAEGGVDAGFVEEDAFVAEWPNIVLFSFTPELAGLEDRLAVVAND